MKDLKIALIDFDPTAYNEAWEATYQWGHQVELGITEQQQLRPAIEAVRLGKATLDLFVCNRTHVDDKLGRAIRFLAKKPVIRYEVSEIDFYGFTVSPQRDTHETFDELSQLSRLD